MLPPGLSYSEILSFPLQSEKKYLHCISLHYPWLTDDKALLTEVFNDSDVSSMSVLLIGVILYIHFSIPTSLRIFIMSSIVFHTVLVFLPHLSRAIASKSNSEPF